MREKREKLIRPHSRRPLLVFTSFFFFLCPVDFSSCPVPLPHFLIFNVSLLFLFWSLATVFFFLLSLTFFLTRLFYSTLFMEICSERLQKHPKITLLSFLSALKLFLKCLLNLTIFRQFYFLSFLEGDRKLFYIWIFIWYNHITTPYLIVEQ